MDRTSFAAKIRAALVAERNGRTRAEIAALHPDLTEKHVQMWEEKWPSHTNLHRAAMAYNRHWTKPAWIASGLVFDEAGGPAVNGIMMLFRMFSHPRTKDPFNKKLSKRTEARFTEGCREFGRNFDPATLEDDLRKSIQQADITVEHTRPRSTRSNPKAELRH